MYETDNKLKLVWETESKATIQSTLLPDINFNEIINSLISVGPYYFYVVDFFDMSLSNVSPSIKEIHGFDPDTVTFDDIINAIHPDDMDFVAKAEETNIKFIYEVIGKENVMNYKSSYSFRSRMKDGSYRMLNHQAIVLTTDEYGGHGKAINIHTDIDHLTKTNRNTISLIGLKNNPSYTDIKISFKGDQFTAFSNREIEILKFLSEGHSTAEIANLLGISEHTVKTHRKNIHKKSACKNTAELIHKYFAQGLI
jgi:DNA-binding CsgD family transcriptional regulator